MREAFARYAGYEVDYEGDAFFYAFASAQEAVSAVSEAMSGLEAGPIAIRVGVHTGEPGLDPPKYVGMDVHTAARIMSCGHGGQVVVSKTTAALVDTPLQELGEHRLKDIQEAVPLYQLGEGSFPPLKTISNTNLPTPASSFVGRDDELLEVLSRFEEGARLVTLTGPGGTGKTRLAIEAAATARSRVQGRCLLGGPRDAPRSRARHGDDRADAGRQGQPRRAHFRARDALAARQPRAGDRRCAPALRPAKHLRQPQAALHLP